MLQVTQNDAVVFRPAPVALLLSTTHFRHASPFLRRRPMSVPVSGPSPTRVASFGFAFRGLRALLAAEPNARIHLLATVAAVGLGAALHLTALEWCAVVVAMAMVCLEEGLLW